MKRRFNLLILFICCVMLAPSVYAASGSTVMSGTNTIKVGKSTTIYVNVKSSEKIKGADITYKTGGNIKVTGISIGSGLSQMSKNGNRYILYSQNGVKSGSTILAITVKGTSEGTGTVSVTNLVATIGGGDVNCGARSYKITVNPAMTEEEKKAAEKAKEEAEKKAKEEAEKAAKEAAEKEEKRKQAIKDAIEVVKKAETTLTESDYNNAVKAVNALDSGNEKNDLLKRLDDIRIKIAVNKQCGAKNADSNTCDCNNKTGSKITSWIILCAVLFICLAIETAYIITKKMMKKYD